MTAKQRKAGRDAAAILTAAGFAAWFSVTLLTQHPQRVFDRIRVYDPSGALIPDWRFFAPEPGLYDFHVLYRVLTAEGQQTQWKLTCEISARSWTDFIWFPDRRKEKAIFDLCNELNVQMARRGTQLTRTPAYRMLSDHVRHIVQEEYRDQEPPQGFQFVVTRYAGFDETNDPEYLLASPLTEL
jgi:hypothetical protein